MSEFAILSRSMTVPPRKGRVDLNWLCTACAASPLVPPRKGRVDLNLRTCRGGRLCPRPAPQGAGGFKFVVE